jgi:hypothetical protein
MAQNEVVICDELSRVSLSVKRMKFQISFDSACSSTWCGPGFPDGA